MQPLDLTNCDREPIHIPGSIQPHGILLVIDPSSEIVLQAAGDTAGILAQLRQSHWEISRKPLISRGETDGIPGFSEYVVPFPALFSA